MLEKIYNLARGRHPHGQQMDASSVENQNNADVLQLLRNLQKNITTTAIGAARTGMRLTKVARQTGELDQSIHQISQLTGDLKTGVDHVASVSVGTAEQTVATSGLVEMRQAESVQAVESATNLRTHMKETFERLESLMGKIQSIGEISKVVQGIATETKMLSFNAAIEAARAGEAGKGFAVVAEHIQKLAATTAQQTEDIFSILNSINADLEPSRQAILASRDLANATTTQVEKMREAFEQITTLVKTTTTNMESIATAASQQKRAVEVIFEKVQVATETCDQVKNENDGITKDTMMLSEMVEDAYAQFGKFDTGTTFHRVLGLARELEAKVRQVFEEAIDSGRLSLDDVLALRYREIKGSESSKLSRLFDVSKAPLTGFDPPKYFTAYDHIVDVAIQRIADDIKKRERALTFAIPVDLNTYAPIHNKEYCNDLTGIHEKDLSGNRAKRFFLDSKVLIRGARMGLGPAAIGLADKPEREDFVRVAGSNMKEPSDARDHYLVQTYARDTGAIMTVLSLPVFVKGQRYGSVIMGWSE